MRQRILLWRWCVWAIAPIALAAEPPPAVVALPAAVAPTVEVRAAAKKSGWPLEPVVIGSAPGAAQAGDGVVALITLWSGTNEKQWLVRFEVDELNEAERKQRYQSAFTFSGAGWTSKISGKTTLALKIQALGPFTVAPYDPKTAAKAATDQSARTLVSPDFLAIGLDRACQVMLTTGHSPEAKSHDAKSPSPDAPSVEDQKTITGSVIALLQFFIVAQSTPGIREILWEVIDLPSVWTLAKSLGKISPGFNWGTVPTAAVDPAGWKIPAGSYYRYPFGIELNSKPAVNCELFVTAPHPPMLTTAGIVGITAESPSHKDKRALIQVVASYRGKNESAAKPPPPP